jgi:prepilin signal peptidase PulO-like enzyme (type II secretory pathway)
MNPMSNITYVFPAILGWFAGWLVNYLADVLPITRHFSQPTCRQCGAEFQWKEYLLFRSCPNRHPRPMRVWISQIAILAMSIYIWITPPPKIEFFPGLILLAYLGTVFVIDLEHRLILHPTSIFGALFGLVIGIIGHGASATLLGGLGGFGIMMTFYLFGILFTRIRTRRLIALGQEPDDEEALGSGDVILVTILGFIVGWPLIWLCLLYGILLGGLVSLTIFLWLIVSGRYKTDALMTFIPYGPYFIFTTGLIVYFPKFLSLIVPG